MSTDGYVPSDEQVRGRHCDGTYVQTGHTTEGEDFDAWFARVRRDAAGEALDGLIAWHRENAQDAETPAPIRRGIAVMADEAQRYRDAHYPEETP